MNDKIKFAIKSIPGVSNVAVGLNRTVVHSLRKALDAPKLKRNNNVLNAKLRKLDSGKKHIWYFGFPTHANLGDQAQKFVILSWLEKNYPGYDIVKIPSNAFNGNPSATIAEIERVLGPQDLFIMQSGHTMSGLHPDEVSHRMIPLSFPENKIVFFPTSIEFLSKKGKREDIRAIDAHRKLLFLARDRVSYGIAREIYPHVNIQLFPDVVTSLLGGCGDHAKRKGVLLCCRNDGEKLYSYEALDKLANRLRDLDVVERSDTSVDWKEVDFDSGEAWGQIEATIQSYAGYRCIVTDRYHGTIFGRIVGTPVVVLRTNDHKVTSGAEWFCDAGDRGLTVADNLDEAVALTERMMQDYPYGVAAPAFASEYYNERLRAAIDSL